MAFMQSTTGDGEDFKVYVKYNAKAGRWYTKEDKPDADEFEVHDMTAVFDFANLKTGWFLFAPGVAPVKQLNAEPKTFASRPGDDFKKGFQIEVFSNKNLLGVREFCSTAGVVIDAMNTVHDRYEEGVKSNPGKLPIIKCVTVKPIVGNYGTNYSPVLEIVGWADRPAELTKVDEPQDNGPKQLVPAGVPAFDSDLDDDVPF